ncbi:hypothetical protein [Streptomyces sp. NBC_00338]|uniref:hypothetical protein n=1 Tax=Streptomyces sp. NBC_00338 TaxID=2975715 RepID=UPI00338D36A6
MIDSVHRPTQGDQVSEETTESDAQPEVDSLKWEYGYPGDLKRGIAFRVNGKVYRLVSAVSSKPGKHGSAKYRIEATGLPGGEQASLSLNASDRILVAVNP